MLLNYLEGTDPSTEPPVTDTSATANKNIFDDWLGKLLDTTTVWGQITMVAIKVIIALLILLISFAIINAVCKSIYKRLDKKHADATLSKVGTSTARIVLKVLVVICLIGFVGIETASLSALIAAVGVGFSMALQGTLSNFAGGIIIIVMRPFKLGDYIVSNGQEGTVEDIKLFYTTLVTPDNRVVSIPNGSLANNVIVNNTAKDTRRMDLIIQVAYGTDTDKAKAIIAKVCEQNELVFKDPAPFIELKEMNESSLDIVVRVWCNRPDYWTVNFGLIDSIKKALDANGIEIPFKQIDVHINNVTPALPAPASEEVSEN
ncbi:MAG: mechanosensitive ion channel family protein [Candidatus Coproplasma sp.]